MMHYDICISSIVESGLTSLQYLDCTSLVFEDIGVDGEKRTGQISKEFIEKTLKKLDFIPALEDCLDIIEFTRDFENSKKGK